MRKTVLDTSQTQPVYKVDYAVPVTVDKTATVFEVIGNRKIVRAGTIVSSTKNLMGANQEKVLTDNTKGKGILIADIDITDGDAIGTALVSGIVFAERIPNAPTIVNYNDYLGNGLIQAVSIKR